MRTTQISHEPICISLTLSRATTDIDHFADQSHSQRKLPHQKQTRNREMKNLKPHLLIAAAVLSAICATDADAQQRRGQTRSYQSFAQAKNNYMRTQNSFGRRPMTSPQASSNPFGSQSFGQPQTRAPWTRPNSRPNYRPTTTFNGGYNKAHHQTNGGGTGTGSYPRPQRPKFPSPGGIGTRPRPGYGPPSPRPGPRPGPRPRGGSSNTGPRPGGWGSGGTSPNPNSVPGEIITYDRK